MNKAAIKYYPYQRTSLVVCSAVHLEELISTTIFRNNLNNDNEPSRIIMATNDYEFKKRLIQLNQDGEWDKVNASTYRFPFCTYDILNHNFAPKSGNSFALSRLKALSDVSVNLNSLRVECDIPVKFYFDRFDDSSIAYEILLFDAPTKHSFTSQYKVKNSYIVDVPIEIQVKDCKYTQENKEKEWLTDNKIYCLEATYHIESLLLSTPTFPDESQGYDLINIDPESPTEQEIKEGWITTRVQLDWYQKNGLTTDSSKIII